MQDTTPTPSTGQAHCVAVEGVSEVFHIEVWTVGLLVQTLVPLCSKPSLDTVASKLP